MAQHTTDVSIKKTPKQQEHKNGQSTIVMIRLTSKLRLQLRTGQQMLLSKKKK
jgi:hypothetical protein